MRFKHIGWLRLSLAGAETEKTPFFFIFFCFVGYLRSFPATFIHHGLSVTMYDPYFNLLVLPTTANHIAVL